MKIYKHTRPSTDRGCGAVIQVEPGEPADVEAMLILLDGDCVGHFGIEVKLISEDNPPELRPKMYGGKRIGPGYMEAVEQFGHPNASTMRKKVRYYQRTVHRD